MINFCLKKARYCKEVIVTYPDRIILIVATFAFFPLFFAKFAIIDDHEIFLFLSRFRVLGFYEMLTSLFWLPDLGGIPRFRPIYYVFRTSEILLWQNCALFWTMTRFLIATFFAVAVRRSFDLLVFPGAGIIAGFYVLFAPWIADIFFRYGPAESYAIFFCGLLLVLLSQNRSINWVGVCFCVTMLVGIKENFIVLIPILIYASYRVFSEKKIIQSILVFLSLLFVFWCLYILVGKVVVSAGVDIYGNSVGRGRFSKIAADMIGTTRGIVSCSVIIMALLFIKRQLRIQRHTAYIMLFLLMVALFQLLFYGEIPRIRGRYAFPYWPVMLTILLFLFGRSVFLERIFFSSQLRAIAGTTLVVYFLVLAVSNETRATRQAWLTNSVNLGLVAIVDNATRTKEIVVNAGHYGDVEAIGSITRYLDFLNVDLPRYLFVDEGPVQSVNPFLNELFVIMRNGHDEYRYLPFSSRSGVQGNCLEIYFRDDVSKACDIRIKVPF